MSRRDEVEASIKWIISAGMTGGAITPNLRDLARTLADEVDELRGKLDDVREVFGRICKGNEVSEAIDDMDAILYPAPETTDAITEGRDNG